MGVLHAHEVSDDLELAEHVGADHHEVRPLRHALGHLGAEPLGHVARLEGGTARAAGGMIISLNIAGAAAHAA